MYKAIYASAWDLADDGRDAALESIRETGVNTVTLAVSQPRPERYGHLKPRVHPMVRESDALTELQRAASDLDRAVWVESCLDTPSDVPHDDYVSRNALGEPYPHRLCPAHPAVRDYVVNLCCDLAHGYDRPVLETPGWLPCDQGYHPEFATAPLDRCARTLLSLCFAATTRHAAKAAGIDADRLQAQVCQVLESFCDAPVAPHGHGGSVVVRRRGERSGVDGFPRLAPSPGGRPADDQAEHLVCRGFRASSPPTCYPTATRPSSHRRSRRPCRLHARNGKWETGGKRASARQLVDRVGGLAVVLAEHVGVGP